MLKKGALRTPLYPKENRNKIMITLFYLHGAHTDETIEEMFVSLDDPGLNQLIQLLNDLMKIEEVDDQLVAIAKWKKEILHPESKIEFDLPNDLIVTSNGSKAQVFDFDLAFIGKNGLEYDAI